VDDYYEVTDSQNEEYRPRDPAIDDAADRLRTFFETSPQRVFYSTQIQTSLEREFFHWIVGKALVELADDRRITRVPVLISGQSVNFYANRKHRYIRRQINTMTNILRRIFDPDFAQAIGRHGELMFDAALGRNGFRAEAMNANSWNGKFWIQSNQNLDRIITREGIAYGVEIKNTQNYIPHHELQAKLSLCLHLGLKPLFIMRFAPKSYIFETYQNGGFTLLFEEQLYPLGHTTLLNEVK
jgi:hypothetical protein